MIKILGHRGARNLWPENSLQGFAEAIRLGVDIVECDVHPSSDGELMVVHDTTLERTTEGAGLVAEQTAAELGRTRLRDSPEGIPTLDAVLDVVQATEAELFVEIKTDALGRPYPGMEARVLEKLRRRGMLARSAVVSFVPEILEAARMVEPTVQVLAPVFRNTSQMHGGLPGMLDRLDRIPDLLFSIERDMFKPALDYCFGRIRQERRCVGVCNDPAELAFWFRQPVRQIHTDRPDLALAARAAVSAAPHG